MSNARNIADLNFDNGTLFVDRANDRVGVGTSSPTSRLHVYSGTDARLQVENPATGYATLAIKGFKTFLWQSVPSTDASGGFRLFDESTPAERMRIDVNGNVGIGSNAPAAKLDVVNAAASHSLLRLYQDNASYNTDIALVNVANTTSNTLISKRTSGDLWLYQSGANNIAFYTNNAERMRITSGGSVGIGTSSPGVTLDVNGSARIGSNYKMHFGSTTNGGYIDNNFGNDDLLQFVAKPSGLRVLNSAANTELVRIDASGYFLVGTSTYQGDGTSIASRDIFQKQPGYSYWKITTFNGNYYFNYGGADKATINGSTGAYTALSDADKKTNIQDSTKGLDVAMQLRPVNYKMVDGDDAVELGFIAQEVQPLIPEAYVEQEGSGGKFIGLSDRPIIAVLTKAIQEQQELIVALQASNAALEARIAALEAV